MTAKFWSLRETGFDSLFALFLFFRMSSVSDDEDDDNEGLDSFFFFWCSRSWSFWGFAFSSIISTKLHQMCPTHRIVLPVMFLLVLFSFLLHLFHSVLLSRFLPLYSTAFDTTLHTEITIPPTLYCSYFYIHDRWRSFCTFE